MSPHTKNFLSSAFGSPTTPSPPKQAVEVGRSTSDKTNTSSPSFKTPTTSFRDFMSNPKPQSYNNPPSPSAAFGSLNMGNNK